MRAILSLLLEFFIFLPPAFAAGPADTEQAIDRFLQREHAFTEVMRTYTPMVETYLQRMTEYQQVLGTVPSEDRYFLGRLRVEQKIGEHFFMAGDKALVGKFQYGRSYSTELSPIGFSSMIFVDREAFDRAHYDFKFQRREFVGEVLCLVYDVFPKKNSGKNRFNGRIWVEDQEFNIIRFNGTYGTFHLESWRLNLRPGLWLPAFVYSEETELKHSSGKAWKFMAQTRFWGYNLRISEGQEELTQVVVDPKSEVRDASGEPEVSPLAARRAWMRRAEDNILEKLEQAGLLAPEGEVDKILQTVLNNLAVTNDITLEPEPRCRVLLTTPLESATLGHTILISRGLLDVLPDEASLAMVLSHSLAHMVKKHELSAMYAFNDRTHFPDATSLRELDLRFTPEQEREANQAAFQVLKNSPYKDKLNSGGLFLKALGDFGRRVPNLMKATLGNNLADGNSILWMTEVAAQAPELKYEDMYQIPALPLGSRIKLDQFSNQVKLIKATPARMLQPEDKLLFAITPFSPYVTRLKPSGTTAVSRVGQ